MPQPNDLSRSLVAPCTARYPSLLTALAPAGPHTRAKSRAFAVGGKIARDTDSPLEGRVTSELVSEMDFRSSQKIRFSAVFG